MIAVRMVQVAADEEVGVVAVGHGLMAAAGAVLMPLLVFTAVVARRASRGVDGSDLELVLLHVLAALVMQVPVMQVIDVAFVLDRRVAAVGAVLMVVVGVIVSQG